VADAQQKTERDVYLVEVTSDGAASVSGKVDLALFATNLLFLQLKAGKAVRVLRQAPPRCETQQSSEPTRQPAQQQPSSSAPPAAPSQTAQPPTSQTLAPQTPVQVAAAQGAAGDFYVVEANIVRREAPGRSPQTVLAYELFRQVGCVRRSVIRRTETLTDETALQSMIQMADVLTVTLDEELSPPKTLVNVSVDPAAGNLARHKEPLADQLVGTLAGLEEFKPRDLRKDRTNTPRPEYEVTGKFVTTNNRPAVQFVVTNVKRDKRHSSRALLLPPAAQQDEQKLTAFYADAANVAAGFLRDVRDADNVGIEGPLEAGKINAIEQKISELLCINNPPNCETQAEAAIPLLEKLTELRESRTPERLMRLGNAYALTENHLDAAQAYDDAWKETPDTNRQRIEFLKKAGEAWYKAKSYENAADRLDQAIKLSNRFSVAQTHALHLQRATGYRFANQPVKALQAILQSLVKFPNDDPLEDELKAVVKDLRGSEQLKAAAALLGTPGLPAGVDDDLLKDVQKRLAAELASEAVSHFFIRDTAALDRTLQQFNALPANAVSDEVKQEVVLPLAASLVDKGAYDRALAVLEQEGASPPGDNSNVEVLRSYTYFARAQKRAGANPRADYEKAASILADMDGSRLLGLKAMVAHGLGKDEETRHELEETIRGESPDALKALTVLSFVCTNYLADPACAASTAQRLENAGLSSDADILNLAENYLVRGQHAEATRHLKVLSARASSEEPYKLVTLFYRIWILVAERKQAEAAEAFKQWTSEVQAARKVNLLLPARWEFDGALRALEASTQFSPQQKETLRNMMEAINDESRPLPTALP
jgi:tetratricopeptide (TPR) repeat protein